MSEKVTFFADLEACTYFDRVHWFDCTSLKAIGWLSRGLPYAQGGLSHVASEKLATILSNCWTPFHYKGSHTCELCSRVSTSNNLFVPGRGVVYVSPDMIGHYVDAHSYKPPREFLDAVTACPEMGSEAYFSAITEQGGKHVAQLLRLLPEDPKPCPVCGEILATPRAMQCRACMMEWRHDPDNPRPF